MRVARTIVQAAATAVFGLAVLLFLGALGLHFAGYQMLAVRSGSMTPEMAVGSLAVTEHFPAANLQVGDVIAFHPPGQPDIVVTHRIVAREVQQSPGQPPVATLITKGDANPAPDPWRLVASGSSELRIAVIPGAGYALTILGDPSGRMAVLIVPALLLAISLLVELWAPVLTAGGRAR
jgi:signal peptidase